MLIFLGIAGYAYFGMPELIAKENGFSLEPVKEVALIFIGIFGTMMPAEIWPAR